MPEPGDGQRRWYEIERIHGAPPRGRKWRVIGPDTSPYVVGGPC